MHVHVHAHFFYACVHAWTCMHACMHACAHARTRAPVCTFFSCVACVRCCFWWKSQAADRFSFDWNAPDSKPPVADAAKVLSDMRQADNNDGSPMPAYVELQPWRKELDPKSGCAFYVNTKTGHARTHARTHACMHSRTHMHAHTRARMHARTHRRVK